jgi:hypothetical protein
MTWHSLCFLCWPTPRTHLRLFSRALPHIVVLSHVEVPLVGGSCRQRWTEMHVNRLNCPSVRDARAAAAEDPMPTARVVSIGLEPDGDARVRPLPSHIGTVDRHVGSAIRRMPAGSRRARRSFDMESQVCQ